jgi:hypothetical protein
VTFKGFKFNDVDLSFFIILSNIVMTDNNIDSIFVVAMGLLADSKNQRWMGSSKQIYVWRWGGFAGLKIPLIIIIKN